MLFFFEYWLVIPIPHALDCQIDNVGPDTKHLQDCRPKAQACFDRFRIRVGCASVKQLRTFFEIP